MAGLGDSGWFEEAFKAASEKSARDIGRFNMALFGKTGVGKSTLVNAIFGEYLAATGIGEPVTRSSQMYMHKSGVLGVLDTVGLEIGKDSETILSDLEEYVSRMRSSPTEEHIHVAWYCVRSSDRRFEEVEADFVRSVHRLGVPVIVALTQVPVRNGSPHPDVVALAESISERRLPIFGGAPILTMAQGDPFNQLEEHGLDQLLEATFRVAPEGVSAAINAAQKISLKRKVREARQVTSGTAAAAAATAITPIPFSDAAALVPLQLGMMAKISLIFGVRVDMATAAALAATTAASAVGRSLAGNLIKLVPGLGSLVGGTINATVASGITYAMGEAWMAVCQQLAQGRLRVDGMVDTEAIRNLFKEEFAARVRRRIPGQATEAGE